MVAPDVQIEDGKGTILISSEEGETEGIRQSQNNIRLFPRRPVEGANLFPWWLQALTLTFLATLQIKCITIFFYPQESDKKVG